MPHIAHYGRTQSVVTLCAVLNIPVEGTKKKIEPFLHDAGVASPSNNCINHLKEVAATLAWARYSISNGAEPDSWINDVSPAAVALLRTLYPLQRQTPAIRTASA